METDARTVAVLEHAYRLLEDIETKASQPGPGTYDGECPLCMGELLEKEDRTLIAYIKSHLKSLTNSGFNPMELNEDTIFILGRPNFWCGSIAPALRKAGHEIPRKAEDEQAHVIHWLLSLYEKHGAGWREKANQFLKEFAKNQE